ncbi:putative Extra-large G-protein 1 [Hibiscus syriacus]|uniref:Extra-large G-protein 1 n=1 Tax=Hibiscus syriacus TaxID=106335 RepID=A0A6A3CDH0_HIBSY|nr:putative Extra-large G-protein 1 [Hibiscus syriacus]
MSAIVGEWMEEVAAKLKEKVQARNPFMSIRAKKEQRFAKEGRVGDKEASKDDTMSEATVCMLIERRHLDVDEAIVVVLPLNNVCGVSESFINGIRLQAGDHSKRTAYDRMPVAIIAAVDVGQLIMADNRVEVMEPFASCQGSRAGRLC